MFFPCFLFSQRFKVNFTVTCVHPPHNIYLECEHLLRGNSRTKKLGVEKERWIKMLWSMPQNSFCLFPPSCPETSSLEAKQWNFKQHKQSKPIQILKKMVCSHLPMLGLRGAEGYELTVREVHYLRSRRTFEQSHSSFCICFRTSGLEHEYTYMWFPNIIVLWKGNIS